MVLEPPKPASGTWTALAQDSPVLLAYVLSFVYLGIYWNNHHHMFHAVSRVRGGVLWANLHRRCGLAFAPYVGGWRSEEWGKHLPHPSNLPAAPVEAYGVVLLLAAV